MATKDVTNTYVCTLSEESLLKAKKELNENPETRMRDVQTLRTKVLAHPGLKTRTDDAFLLRFLRARKFDIERAYDLLVNYHQVRAENAEHFQNFKPSAVKKTLEDQVSVVLPYRDKNGCRMLYFRPGRWDSTSYSIYDIMRTNIMNMEKVIEEEETQVNGIVLVGHLDGVGMVHVRNFERNYARIFTTVLQDAFPARFKGIHFCHEPTVVSYIYSILKYFLREKLTNRIIFYGEDLSQLHENFGKDRLPQELGGNLESSDNLAKEWEKTLLESEAMFEEMAKYSIAVERSIMKEKNEEKVENLVGTYRKLNVD